MKHMYLAPGQYDGSGSSRSNEESNGVSPKPHHVYAVESSCSIRENDIDANANSPKEHVYAFQ